MNPSPPAHRQRGFVLIVVLWATAILALLITGLVSGASREARLTATLREQVAGKAAADAVLCSVIMELLRSGHAGPAVRRFTGIPVVILLEDYSGRMNPNIASARMLRALLLELGVVPRRAERLASAMVDWRSPGRVASPNGAKAPEYQAAGLRYGPPGRPFENLDEIGYVLGMDKETLAALRPHLTLWSASDPDPAFADRFVLAALRSTGAPPTAGKSTEARIIAITARAGLNHGQSAVRRAVVQFGYSPDGRDWRVLAWDDGATP
jgi:general secretion pathway protein K